MSVRDTLPPCSAQDGGSSLFQRIKAGPATQAIALIALAAFGTNAGPS